MNTPNLRGRFAPSMLLAVLFGLNSAACIGSPVDPNDDPSDGSGPLANSSSTSVGAGGSDGSDSGCDPGDTDGDGSVGAGGGDGVDEPAPEAPAAKPARGVRITEVVLNQGVRHTLMAEGVPVTSSVPLVASRPGIVRVFYETDSQYDGKSVQAVLTVGGHTLTTETVLGQESADGELASTVNFSLPADWITPTSTFRVELNQVRPPSVEPNPAASYPTDLPQALDVKPASALEVVLVPITYDADNSGRVPDTTASQIASYRDQIFMQFPAAKLSISVRAPFAWDKRVQSTGTGWSDLLHAIADLRAGDQVSRDTYYYGIFAPDETFQAFCSSGCVAGLGFVSPAFSSWSRVSIGLGFTGDRFAQIAVHELGHNHGREHSPCGGVSGPDPLFPNAAGQIGAWGFDLLSHELKHPSTADFMSYCDPAWVSDYTYTALYERMSLVSPAQFATPAQWQNRTYDRVGLGSNDELRWLEPITLETPPMGDDVELTVARSGGEVGKMRGQMFRYDHLPGGVMFIPRPVSNTKKDVARSVEFEINGKRRRLAR